MAVDLAREVSERVRSFGSHLEGREPGQLLDEARDFARRRPGTFLLGALAAGVVAGRLFRATADGAAAASLAESGDQGGIGSAGSGVTPVPSGTSHFGADTALAGHPAPATGTGEVFDPAAPVVPPSPSVTAARPRLDTP
jgi:hypothetical protein